MKFEVTNLEDTISGQTENSKKIFLVKETTLVEIEKSNFSKIQEIASEKKERKQLGFDSIGGVSSQIKQVMEVIETSLMDSSLFKKFGLKPPKGILLYGPPGTGKVGPKIFVFLSLGNS